MRKTSLEHEFLGKVQDLFFEDRFLEALMFFSIIAGSALTSSVSKIDNRKVKQNGQPFLKLQEIWRKERTR